MKSRKYIKQQADKLLSKLTINLESLDNKHIPINLDKLSRKLGIQIVEYPFSDKVSGAFVKKGDNLLIGINENHHEHRKRFTIAHEIGHYILHSDNILHYDTNENIPQELFHRSEVISDPHETEANHYAAELLMPEEFVKKFIYKNGFKSISKLAEKFNVSEKAMEYRLINLGIM